VPVQDAVYPGGALYPPQFASAHPANAVALHPEDVQVIDAGVAPPVYPVAALQLTVRELPKVVPLPAKTYPVCVGGGPQSFSEHPVRLAPEGLHVPPLWHVLVAADGAPT